MESGCSSSAYTASPLWLRALLLGAVLSLGASPLVLAQVPAIDVLDVTRSGDDLVIAWSPAAGDVDGYRVYRYRGRDCSGEELLHEGPDTSYVVQGAFLELATALYRVAAYVGTERGPLTAPAYKLQALVEQVDYYRVMSPPYVSQADTSQKICDDINGQAFGEEILLVTVSYGDRGVPYTAPCHSAIWNTDILPGEGLTLLPTEPDSRGLLWGHGHVPWTIELSYAPPSHGMDHGCHAVSLPYEHTYQNLLEVAEDIPTAIEVGLMLDVISTGEWDGLKRASSSEPWQGDNLPLDGDLPYGLWIKVDGDYTWTPDRTPCQGTPGGPGSVNHPPVADAGGPYFSLCHTSGMTGIWLDGSASYDPDGDELRYAWTTTCTGEIEMPDEPETPAWFECDPCESAACEVTLTVTDEGGLSDEDSASVNTWVNVNCLTDAPDGTTPMMDW